MNNECELIYENYLYEGYIDNKHTRKFSGQPICPRCPKDNACPDCPNVIPALADIAKMTYNPNANPPYAEGITHGGNTIKLQIEENKLVIIKNEATIGYMPVRNWNTPDFIRQLKDRIKHGGNDQH